MDAIRIFIASGLIRKACTRGFWPLLFVRLVTEVELSPFQLVALGTVMELSILTMEIPTGVVADVYSRKWSIVVSFLVMGSAFAMSGLVEPYWLLIVSQVLIGFGNTFETGAETAWITSEVGSAAAVEGVILRRARLELVASVVGIVGFSALAAVTSLTFSLVTIGLIFAGWGFALAVLMGETNFVRSDGDGWTEFVGMLKSGFGQTKRVKSLRFLVLALFCFGLAKEAIDRLDVQRLVDVGLPSDIDEVVVIGALTAVKLLLASLLLLVATRRAAGRGVVPALALLLAGSGLAIVLLAHVDLLVIAGLGLILQGGFGFAIEPLVTTWTNTFAADESRATVHSFMGQAEAFGEILGGLALGVVAELWSIPTAMTISVLLMLAGAATALRARATWSADVAGAQP